MSDKIEYSRLIQKRFSQTGVVPTIPASGSTTLSQLVYTDLLIGEIAFNLPDKRMWFRAETEIVEIFGVSGGTYANLFIEGDSDTSINSIPNNDSGGINVGEYNFTVGENNSTFADNSAVVGGFDNTINVDSLNSVILGGSGNNIVSGATNVIMLGCEDTDAFFSDATYAPNLVITDDPLTGSTITDRILVRGTNGLVNSIDVSDLPSGSNQNLLQVLQTGDYAEYGDTAYYLGQDGFFVDGTSTDQKSYLIDHNANYTQISRSDDFNPSDGSTILLDSNGIRLESNSDVILGANVVNNKITYDGQTMDVENVNDYIASATTNSFMPKSYIDSLTGDYLKLDGTSEMDVGASIVFDKESFSNAKTYIENTGIFKEWVNPSQPGDNTDSNNAFTILSTARLSLGANYQEPTVKLDIDNTTTRQTLYVPDTTFEAGDWIKVEGMSTEANPTDYLGLDSNGYIRKVAAPSSASALISNEQITENLGSGGLYNINKENDKGKNIVVTCGSPSTVILPSGMLATDEGYAYNIINKKNSSATVYVQWGGTFDYWNLSTGGGMTVYWDGNDWVLLSENLGGLFIAQTSERPTNLTNDDTGYLFGDKTLNKVQVWDGNSWSDILGGGGNSPIEINNTTDADSYSESLLEGKTILLRYDGPGSEIIFNYDVSKCIIMADSNVKVTFDGTVTDCSIKGDGVLNVILNDLVSSTHIIAEEISYVEATSSDFMARDIKACGNIETNNVRLKCETLLTEVTNSGPHFDNCDIDVNEYKIGTNTTDPNELLSCKAQIDLLRFDVSQNFIIDGGYVRVMEALSYVQVDIVANSGYLQYVRHTTTNIRLANGTSTHAYIVDYLDADLTLVGAVSQVLTNDCDTRVIRGQLK